MNNFVAVQLAQNFLKQYPSDALGYLEKLEETALVSVLDALSVNTCAQLLFKISPESSCSYLLETEKFEDFIKVIDLGDLARLISRVSKDKRGQVLKRLATAERKEVEAILGYPHDTAGFLMDTEIQLFHQDDIVEDVVTTIRKKRGKNITSFYLVDESGFLKGRVYLQDLMIAEGNAPLRTIMKETTWVSELTPRDEVADIAKKTSLPSLPVLNADGIVLGIIRYESLFSIAQKDAFDDLQTMVGVSKDEKALSTPFFSMKKRLPWLSINLVTTFLAAFVVGLFEGTIAKITALAVLLPVVAGQSGNTGAQALAITMRGLALREIRLRHKWKVLFKEGLVGLYNGILIGLLCTVSVFFWSNSAPLAIVIGVSMIIAMIAASLAGAAIPMILTAMKQDPATSSSIVLTTVTDIVGFLCFLGLAALFSQHLI